MVAALLLAGAAGCDTVGPPPEVHASDVVGDWCGQDHGRLTIHADGTFVGADLSPTFVTDLVTGLSYDKPRFHPPVTTQGTWHLETESGTQRLKVDFDSFGGAEPSRGASGELFPAHRPLVLVDYLGDPDSGPTYQFARCLPSSGPS